MQFEFHAQLSLFTVKHEKSVYILGIARGLASHLHFIFERKKNVFIKVEKNLLLLKC